MCVKAWQRKSQHSSAGLHLESRANAEHQGFRVWSSNIFHEPWTKTNKIQLSAWKSDIRPRDHEDQHLLST